jgi:very-short-patch-repair endonuclease
MNDIETRIARRAEQHYGVISRDQATGLSEYAITRRVAGGDWLVLLPGVYRMAGAPVTGRQLAFGATLWGGQRSAVSHGTAGALLRLDGVRTQGVHLTIPHSSGRRSDLLSLHRTTLLHDIDRRFVDGIACTSATRTLIDCAPDLDDEAFEVALASARRLGLTTLMLMRQRVEQLCGRGRPGSARIRRVVALADGRALESPLEVRTARLLRASALPAPVPQFRLGPYRLDFAWPYACVGLECDGFERHGDRLSWKRDRRRIGAVEAMGWRTLHVTWDDVTRGPDEVIERIRFALARAV